jgi:hypothetical protein
MIFINGIDDMKRFLLKKLKENHVFWSFDSSKIDVNNISDDFLITKTLIHLDLSDINMLFFYYKPDFIKKVWREQMAISGDYLWTLNRFLAWYYFGIKNPDKYLKTIETKHINRYG